MTRVVFHHNAADRTQAICGLIAARVAAGERLCVYAADEAAAEGIDRALWTFNALSFVPHCREGSPLEADSPVVIGACNAAGAKVLVNYSHVLPPEPSRFDLMVEVVGQDAAEREAARQRFRQYRALGFELTTHDLNEADRHG